MPQRRIVQIDEEKCDGCGLCAPSCAENAIRIVDGKARLISDIYCDGLGACLGVCPQDAISIVERAAEPFDEKAVLQHAQAASEPRQGASAASCPGTALRSLGLNVLPNIAPAAGLPAPEASPAPLPSGLANWPVQLHLVPPHAPFLQDADLLLAADCTPFACADFHRRFLDGRPLLIGCPKLDDGQLYVQKLAQIFCDARIRSVTVLQMEVPCCSGLLRIAKAAAEIADVDVPFRSVIVSIRGEILADLAVETHTGGE